MYTRRAVLDAFLKITYRNFFIINLKRKVRFLTRMLFFKAHPNTAQILMAVVKYKTTMYVPRLGVCSNWLASRLPSDEPVQVWINSGTINFPKDNTTPVIMVGPGMFLPLDSFEYFKSLS